MTDTTIKSSAKELTDADMDKVAGGGKSTSGKPPLKSDDIKDSKITLGPGGMGI